MFDVGFSEIVIILLLVLILLGPKKLPEAARAIGKLFAKARQVSDELKSEITKELDDDKKSSMSDPLQKHDPADHYPNCDCSAYDDANKDKKEK